MSSTTVIGRVRATVLLRNGDGGDARVVTVSWASDRSYPRTRGVGVAFELEAGDGAVLRVAPFEALVTLPVRRTVARDGVRREDAWIAVTDELTIEGQLDVTGAEPTIHARRISLDGIDANARIRLPPGALAAGDVERASAPAAPTEAPDVPAADAAAEPALARRPKKKRPDSSGTPTPIQ
ncbi:MAG TPA: hypothetical protein VH560_11085 [Polyangia bacterium]|jgi:hypothetical protein|nr:hypothetical protein [Polyangia bacterium]